MHANAPWQDYQGAAGGFPQSFMRSSSLGQRCAHDLLVGDVGGAGRAGEVDGTAGEGTEGTAGDVQGELSTAAGRAVRHSFVKGSGPS